MIKSFSFAFMLYISSHVKIFVFSNKNGTIGGINTKGMTRCGLGVSDLFEQLSKLTLLLACHSCEPLSSIL